MRADVRQWSYRVAVTLVCLGGCATGLEEDVVPSAVTFGAEETGSELETSGADESGGSGGFDGSTGGDTDGNGDGLEDDTGGLDGDESGELPPADPVCGDGIVSATEECDDGQANSPSGMCTPQCTTAYCGDGFVHVSEACDDANNINEDACLNSCAAAACGDGVVQQGVELCDDGNLNDSDACTSTCTLASCGDGVVQPPEECDDGNASTADSCLNTCGPAGCGDGIVQSPEECDDGNLSDSDACLGTCEQATCGDGEIYVGVEECDGGGDPTIYSCSETCQDQQVWYQWSFAQFNLPTPMACADFTTWRSALADDHTSITLAGTYDMDGRTCNGAAATQLCNALRLGVSTTVDCGGHTWHVGDCVGTLEVTVDGTGCDCAGPGYALRPCVPYVDWGGVATNTCSAPSQEIYIECGFN